MAAESVVSFVIERLGNLIIQKSSFLKGVTGQVRRLQDELVTMQCFLEDADQKQDEDQRLRNWISQIRAVAYDVEDVIEIFRCKIESLENKGFIRRLAYYPAKLFWLNKVGKEVDNLQVRIKDIADSREKYGIKNLGEGTSTQGEEFKRLRRSSPFIEDSDVVGCNDKIKDLVTQLLKKDSRRCVVSIVGMGGVGKTTLAKKVYNHADIRTRFDSRAWVYVSKSYNYRDVLEAILSQVKTLNNELLLALKNMQEQELEQMLYKELEDKCYFVVLDDIWKEEDWDCLAKVFPEKGNASRLLLTSRNQNVPIHADPRSVPYALKTLGEEESWQLFLKKAINDGVDSSCPAELEDTGREITKRCGGLPLAITVIGGLLLGKKKLKSEWEKVLNNISTNFSRSLSGVSPILELSYADLPRHLKFCFLYLGLFPENYLISTRNLIPMWIAEGIIQNRGITNLEEIAEEYLEQLINRNMVQVGATRVDYRVKSCRIHDLLRELAISKAEDENFLRIHGVRDDFQTLVRSRYIAVHCLSESLNFSVYPISHVRTLLFFDTASLETKISVNFRSFKLLRVLNLEDMNVEYLPGEISEVRLLRYLNLRNTYIEKLPHSLSRLHNLQTLDVFTLHAYVKVPNKIWKLENIKHLYMSRIQTHSPLMVEGLKHLQTLSRIHFDDLTQNNLLTLTSLRKLGILLTPDSEIDKLGTSLLELGNLQSLSLYSVVQVSELPSLAGLSDLCNISELKLSGKLNMLPSFHPNLSRLSLIDSDLTEDPMPILKELRQLSFLKLVWAYHGRQITILKDGFDRLKFLELTYLSLNEIKVEKGAMADLRCLRISNCSTLEMIPEELKYMTALEKLELVNMPEDFFTRLQGVDSYKVCHVPTVVSSYHETRRSQLYKKAMVAKIRVQAQAIRAAYLFLEAGRTN